ncbi:hypothetical protein BKA61DRAFT_720664 [Leptodontidium sp. MPI-SDFR-AT-0119]|nr:hypothetical protein BKA61DRAFT_720664 [Leptodontidium sp. MPI-SDFR-AT-0119]
MASQFFADFEAQPPSRTLSALHTEAWIGSEPEETACATSAENHLGYASMLSHIANSLTSVLGYPTTPASTSYSASDSTDGSSSLMLMPKISIPLAPSRSYAPEGVATWFDAYSETFLPNLPFLHISTLDFETHKRSSLLNCQLPHPSGHKRLALLHQVVCSTQLCERRLDVSTPSYRSSLLALARDARLWELAESSDHVLNSDCEESWLRWVRSEERRRTYFAILFLVSATGIYCNQAPDIDLRVISLQLPSEEALWNADSAIEWYDQISSSHLQREKEFKTIFCHLFISSAVAESADGAHEPHLALSSIEPVTSVTTSRHRPDVSEFGCLTLISALNLLVHRWC